jgi:hypothetical protein
MAAKLGVVLKDIRIPDAILTKLQESLTCDQNQLLNNASVQRNSLEQRLAAVQRRMDQAYQDKLDEMIPQEFWERKMLEWTEDERQIQAALTRLEVPSSGPILGAKRILELANKAYSLYLTQNPTEQAILLRMVLLNCSVDAASVCPTYRKPFDLICRRATNQEWSGREDLNLRPPGPEILGIGQVYSYYEHRRCSNRISPSHSCPKMSVADQLESLVVVKLGSRMWFTRSVGGTGVSIGAQGEEQSIANLKMEY